jgi:fructose-1,6-bisphosphatase/inositol monophosphatase family enzyme
MVVMLSSDQHCNFSFSQPYDFLSLIPVIEGAGGVITDWKGNQLHWEASPDSSATSTLIICNIFFF